MNPKIPACTERCELPALRSFVQRLFEAGGLDGAKAGCVSEILIEADLMGHVTHGLALAPQYLDALANGTMRAVGEPEVVSDRGACVTWRGRRLPGPWLTTRAVDLAIERAVTYGTATVVVSDSHHIGALGAYLTRATDRGLMLFIVSSVPSLAGVAPAGGMKGVFSPNPVAAGIPTNGDPLLIDVSASITTLNMTRQLAKAGLAYPAPWALDGTGLPTTDPQTVIDQGGALLTTGGLDHGHKGYGWALMAEAWSQGLAGFGRADEPAGISLSVFIQVIDPDAFGGRDAYRRQTGWLADTCRASPPRPGAPPVRVPGELALRLKRDALANGVELGAGIVTGLHTWSERLGVDWKR